MRGGKNSEREMCPNKYGGESLKNHVHGGLCFMILENRIVLLYKKTLLLLSPFS